MAQKLLKEMEDTVSAGDSGTSASGRDVLNQELRVINVGLDIFKDALTTQGVNVVQVDWEVPAKGDEKVISILKKMY